MNNSITSRLILALTLSAGAIIALALLLDYRLSRQEILNRLQEESRKTIADVEQDLERALQGIEGNTRFLGGIIAREKFTEPELERILADTVARHEEVFGAAIALEPTRSAQPDGFAPYFYESEGGIARSDFTRADTPYWQLNWYSDAASNAAPVWIEPYFDSGGAEVFMTTYSVPMYTTDNEGNRNLYGVVTADITLRELHRYLKRLELGDHGLGFLMSRGGLVLSSQDSSARMQPYQQLIPNSERQQFWRKLLATVEPGESSTHYAQCDLVEGACISRIMRLHHSGWILGVIYSERDVLADLRAYEYKMLALGLLCLCAMIIVVNLVTRRITRPLEALAASADQLGEGHLDAPLPKAQGSDEIARLILSFAHMKKELKQHIAELEAATASRSRLEGELSAAREIQMAMLPQSGHASLHHDDFDLWATVEPARTVGGDLFTFSLEDRKFYFAVGDVSDKGVPAALFMARAISHLRHPGSHSPGHKLAEVNNALVESNSNCMFVTLILAVLDLDTLELTYASAGHTPPLLLHEGRPVTLLQDSGPATGLAQDQHFPDNRMQLAAGDRLLLYTDGIDEAFSTAGEMFGSERLGQWLAGSTTMTLESAGWSLVETISAFAAGVPQSDDITALLLEVPPSGISRHHQRQFHLTPGITDASLEWLGELLGNALPIEIRNDLQLVLEEVVTNIFKYSGLGEQDEIAVSLAITEQELILGVRDPGIPFNPLRDGHRAQLGADIAHAEIGGLGVHLIEQLTDWQRYRREGKYNCLELGRTLSIS